MKIRSYIFLIFTFCFFSSLLAQEKKVSSSSKTELQEVSFLEEAKRYKEENPQKAIKLLGKVIKAAKKSGNYDVNAEAYFILGNIYEDIGQSDLALERYLKAKRLFELSNATELKAQNYYRLASLQLTLNQIDKSKINFQKCKKISINTELQTLCFEGLASVSFKNENYDEGFLILEEVEQNAQLDSITISRVEAKKADGYIQQNDYKNARNAYDNSVNSLPKAKNKKRSESFEEIEETKERLIEMQEGNEAEQVDIRISNVRIVEKLELPKSNLISDNLKLADIYLKNNKLEEAGKLIQISQSNIDKSTSQEQIAEVFKKSSEFNNLRGNLQLALADNKKFTLANELLLEEKQKELEKQIAIVKGQQNIDLLEKDFILEEKEKNLLESQLQTQKVVIGLLSLLLLAASVFFYFLWQNVKSRRKANQMLLLKSLRTQMNPHFIFNALNSVNNFIAKNDEKAANKFLSNFSRLMRKVLDYSQKDFISFAEEIELNELYLKLEHFRFRDKFEYEFTKNIDVDLNDIDIPPMLIQPFIENAVWHGLRYKEEKGLLKISITQEAENLLINIKDNGIGRAKSRELKTQNQRNYKSTGMANVQKRIELINEIYAKNYQLKVDDLEVGTSVSIFVPLP